MHVYNVPDSKQIIHNIGHRRKNIWNIFAILFVWKIRTLVGPLIEWGHWLRMLSATTCKNDLVEIVFTVLRNGLTFDFKIFREYLSHSLLQVDFLKP